MACTFKLNTESGVLSFDSKEDLSKYIKENASDFSIYTNNNELKFEDQIYQKLKNLDIVSKYKGQYWVKKTEKFQDRNSYAPREAERKNLKKIEDLNKHFGYEAISTKITRGGYIITINPQTSLFSKIHNIQEPIFDKKEYSDWLNEFIYTNDTLKPKDLITNAFNVASSLGREDIKETLNLINRYISLNEDLSVNLVDGLVGNESIPDSKNIPSDAAGMYTSSANKIFLDKNMFSNLSVESNLELISEELLHAITVQPFNSANPNDSEREFIRQVRGLFNEYRRKDPDSKNYRFTNEKEFLVGMMLDKNFKDHLENFIDNNHGNFFQRLWRSIVKAVMNLIGINVKEDLKVDKYYDKMMPIIEDYLSSVKGSFNHVSTNGSNNISYSMIDAERNKLKFNEADQKDFVKKVSNIIDFLKASSTTKSVVDADDNFMYLIKEAKKFSENIVDEVDYFVNFTREFSAIMTLAYDKIKSVKTEDTTSAEKIRDYHKIFSTVKSYSSIINLVKDINEKIPEDAKIKKHINDIIIKEQNIRSNYLKEIEPLLGIQTEKILESSSTLANDKLDKDIAYTKDRLEKAISGGRSQSNIDFLKSRLANLEKEKSTKFNTESEKLQKTMRGELGDANFISSMVEPSIVNGNPLISAVAKAQRDAYYDLGPEMTEMYNSFQTEVEKYEKETGLNRNDIESFNKPLLTEYNVIDGHNEDGTPNIVRQKAIISQFNNNHIYDLQDFTRRVVELSDKIKKASSDEEKAALSKERDAILKEKKQWGKDYMEQPYLEEVHNAQDLMDEDLGGFTAKDYVGAKYDELDKLNKLKEDNIEDFSDSGVNPIEQLELEIKRLRSLWEKDPQSKEYKVALQLKKYDEAIKPFREFVITPKMQKKFDSEKRRIDQMYLDGEIELDQHNKWYNDNVIRIFSEEYWKTKKDILSKLNAIREELKPPTSDRSKVNELYSLIEDIAKAYRDGNGIVDGTKVPEKEAAAVKAMEEEIEKLKEEIPGMLGISKADNRRILELKSLIEQIEFQKLTATNDDDFQKMEAQVFQYEDEIEKLESKKINLDKKLLKQYYDTLKQLSDLDEVDNTKYYNEQLDLEIERLARTYTATPIAEFIYKKSTYTRTKKDVWTQKTTSIQNDEEVTIERPVGVEHVTNEYRRSIAESQIETTQWFNDNHLDRLVYEKNINYDPYSDPKFGTYKYIKDPIYIWKQRQPSNPKYIKDNQPNMRYKNSRIKEEFKNPAYREGIDGYNTPKLSGAKDDRYLNNDYFKMKTGSPSEQATIKYSDFLTQTYSKYQEFLPQSLRLGYALPKIWKSDIERLKGLKAEDVKQHVKDWFEIFKKQTLQHGSDKDILTGYIDQQNTIPVRFIGQMDINDQSDDVTRMILMFSAEVAQRNKLVESFPYVSALRDVLSLSENKPVKLDSHGEMITAAKKFLGNNKVVAKLIPGESVMLRTIDEFIRTHYFGEKIKDEALAKPIDKILGLGAKSLLGLNYLGSVVNYGNAFTQMLIETESKTGLFTIKDQVKAEYIYNANLPEMIEDLGKYGNQSYITQFINYFGGSNFSILGKADMSIAYSKLTQGAAKILVPNEMAEHAIGYQTFIAAALNYKVKKGDEHISLFDAFELKDGIIKIKEGVSLTKEERNIFINRVNAGARRINGNYNKLDKTMAQKFVGWRLAFFMNQYFIPFFVKRFGVKRFSAEDGIQNAGYWREFGRTVGKDLFTYRNNILTNWKDYTDQERTAVLQTITEMGFSFALIGLIAALGGDQPKNIRENSMLANNLIYTLKMLRRQNEQFMLVPGLGLDDIYQKMKSPFPIMAKIGNLFSLMNHGLYFMGYEFNMGVDKKDVYYTSNNGFHNKGDLKMATDVSRLFGLLHRINQQLNPDKTLKNMDAYRIK